MNKTIVTTNDLLQQSVSRHSKVRITDLKNILYNGLRYAFYVKRYDQGSFLNEDALLKSVKHYS